MRQQIPDKNISPWKHRLLLLTGGNTILRDSHDVVIFRSYRGGFLKKIVKIK